MLEPIADEDAACMDENPLKMENQGGLCRKEKRKAAKKLKRKQVRREIALKEQAEEEARLNDLEEQLRIRLKEREEAEILERERKEFELREKLWVEAAKIAEEEAQRKLLEESQRQQVEHEKEMNEDDAWEYVEEGPAEIIWQGNEIIVKKKRVRVTKKSGDEQPSNEDADRPTSNPLPPQSEVFAAYKSTSSASAQHVFESVAQQIPNFGTEQDKAHCPFHIKTGACRFGSRCSRVHFYPDKSCTLLIKNMYNGPGLAWEQDEGLEHLYTDEEVDRYYEEFYEDVHTEFLKFGEIVNFKVCKNGSFHLRGNVYVHYKSLESAVLAYHSINGRYFAGKQITCEFVGVTRWKIAICGEYMKSKLKTCSRGTACNFIHCFRNPGGDYEWADWDSPPPKYWVRKMAALFGSSDEYGYDRDSKPESCRRQWITSKKITAIGDRYHSRRSRSTNVDWSNSGSGRDHPDEYSDQKCSRSGREACLSIVDDSRCKEKLNFEDDQHNDKNIACDHDSGGEYSDRDTDRDHCDSCSRTSSRRQRIEMDFSDEHGKFGGKHICNECERYERKRRLPSHGASRDVDGLQKHRNSSRRGCSTTTERETDFIDQHIKSEESYESDSPGRYDGRCKSHGHDSSADQHDRWETVKSFPDEHGNALRNDDFDCEKYNGRYKSHDHSGGHHNENMFRWSRQSSHRTRSNSWKKERDSSDEDREFKENLRQHQWKHRALDQEKDNRKISQKQEVGYETLSSLKSEGKPGCEQEQSCDLVPDNIQACSLISSQESGGRLVMPNDVEHGTNRKERYNRKMEYESNKEIVEDESSKLSGNNPKLKSASRKRQRSRSPVQHSGRSRKEGKDRYS